MTDRIGTRLGNYRLTELLGSGGFAKVYLGEHIHLGTYAAIKVLANSVVQSHMEAFINEARTIATLDHPHIIHMLEFGIDEEEQTPYLIMTYAPHGNLRTLHPRGTQLEPQQIIEYTQQIASALQYAHDQKIIHRDVKPDNMLVGKNNELLLSDFGLALITHTSITPGPNNLLGTVRYMSPEQIQGRASPASDQYALGVTVYEWLSGHCPFDGSFIEILSQHLHNTIPPIAGYAPYITTEVETVIYKALKKAPEQRFTTMQAFADALTRALSTQQAVAVAAINPQPLIQVMDEETTILTHILSQPDEKPEVDNIIAPDLPITQTEEKPSVKQNHNKISRRNALIGTGIVLTGGIAALALTHITSSHATTPTPPATATPTTSVHRTTEHQPAPQATQIASDLITQPIGTLIANYTGHTGGINRIAWFAGNAETGSRPLASASNDKSALIWSIRANNYATRYTQHTQAVTSIIWPFTGNQPVATSSLDKTVHIWNPLTGQDTTAPLLHPTAINSIAWSPDGKYLAAGDAHGTIWLWNAENWKLMASYTKHTQSITQIAWSPNVQQPVLASASQDKTVHIWQPLNNGDDIINYTQHQGSVNSIAWSPSGSMIVSVSGDQSARVWNAASGTTLNIYTGHTDSINTVAWSPDSSRIATGSDDHTTQIWDALSGEHAYHYKGHKGSVKTVQWSPKGKQIASGGDDQDKTVQIWWSGLA